MKSMKKCYIVGAGDFFGNITPCEDDLVIAADGGFDRLLSLGIVPDILVGDFDSLADKAVLGESFTDKASYRVENCKTKETSFCENDINQPMLRVKKCDGEDAECLLISGKCVEAFRHPVMKDETDMYLAYKIGAERGYADFELYGGVGGREDHTFANYCLLLRAKNDKNDMTLIGNGTKTFVIKNEKKRIFGKCGATVSAFAFGSDAKGVTISGLKYEADGVTLDVARPLGVSNSFLSSGEGEISVIDGALLVTVFER